MRKTYLVPRSNVGIGGFITVSSGVRYHVPSWTVVEKDTTIEDIVMEKRPFEELFEEEKSWKFTSARSGEEYIVRYNARNELCFPLPDCTDLKWISLLHERIKVSLSAAQATE